MKRTLFLFLCLLTALVGVQAQVRITRVHAETSLDASLRKGAVALNVELENREGKRVSSTLEYQLLDPAGREVLTGRASVKKNQMEVSLPELSLAEPVLWNAEKPVLYTLVVRVKKSKNRLMDEARRPLAFRQMRMDDKQLFVNGVPVRVKGVNYRWQEQGGTLTEAQLRKEMEAWKTYHINAVRVSELPQGVPFADLCDAYGIYLLNESAGCDPTHPALREGCLWDWPNLDLPVKLEEMKKQYQDIRFVDFNREAGTVCVKNDFAFTSLDDFDFYYLIRDHGKEVYRDRLTGIQAAPGQSVVSGKMKGYSLERHTTGDVRLEFYAVNRGEKDPLTAKHLVAREQTYIHTFYRPVNDRKDAPVLVKEVVESPESVSFVGDDLKMVFHRRSGRLVSYNYQGEEYIHQQEGPRPFFWRAPTVNDRIARLPEVLSAWREISYQDLTATSFTLTKGEEEVATVKVNYHFNQTDADWEVTYKVYPNGVLKVDNRFVALDTHTPMIPRVGLRWKLNPALTHIAYFGRGPRTNYRDSRVAQFLGVYESLVSGMHEICKRPQENSHRTDIYWCALTGEMKGGLLLVADRTFEMNLGHQLVEDMESGIVNSDASQVDFFVDYRMMGVGADNRQGTPVQEPYLIRPGKENVIQYGFALVPFKKNEDYKKLILKYN